MAYYGVAVLLNVPLFLKSNEIFPMPSPAFFRSQQGMIGDALGVRAWEPPMAGGRPDSPLGCAASGAAGCG